MTLVDAGPLVALFHPSDVDHARCHAVIDDLTTPLVTSWVALGEAMHVLGRWRGWRGQRALWQFVAGGSMEVRDLSPNDAPRAAELMERYRDQPMDLGDATLVVLAEHLDCRRVFTLDRHFRAYRLNGRRAFKVVPE